MSFRGFLIFASIAIALALTISSCTKDQNSATQPPSSSLHLPLPTDPVTFDPRQARDLLTIDVVRLLFSGLTRLSHDGTVCLDLADSVDCDETGLLYHITLKKAFWSDGKMITAHDFAYSWKSMLEKHRAAPNAFQLFWIQNAKEAFDGKKPLDEVGIHDLDDTTLDIELERPCPFFEQLLATPAYLAVQRQHAVTHEKYDEGLDFPMSGPYIVTEQKPQNTITLTSNPHFHRQSAVTYPRIVFSVVDDATAVAMVEAHTLDWAGSPMGTLPIDCVTMLASQKRLRTSPAAGTYFLRANVTHPPLSDPRIREAISLVIDRESLVKNLLQGGQIPAYSLVPPCLSKVKVPNQGVNKKRAKELIKAYCEERGCSPKALTFTLSFQAGDRPSKISMAVQQDIMNALGIDVQLHPCDAKQFYAKVSQLDYDIALSSWFADYFDPHSFYSVFERSTNGTNNTGWESLTYQSLVENSMETRNAEIREQYFAKIEQILAKELPIIPLFHASYNYVNEASVEGIAISPLGYLDIVQP